MGSPDVRAFSRNKRGVAGSLIWINFDRHALLSVFHKARGRFLANKDDIRPQFRMDTQSALDQTAIFNSALVRDAGLPVGATIDTLDELSLSEVSGFKELAAPWFSDQSEQIFGQDRVPSSCPAQPPSRAPDLKHRLPRGRSAEHKPTLREGKDRARRSGEHASGGERLPSCDGLETGSVPALGEVENRGSQWAKTDLKPLEKSSNRHANRGRRF